MPMNRVQFQPGTSLRDFQFRYGIEEQCRKALFEARWSRGLRCPSCQEAGYSRFERLGRSDWQCSACRTQTSLTAGTIFDASKLPLTTWFLAMYFLTQTKTGMSALELHRHLGISYRSAWLVKHKLMQVMFEEKRNRRLEDVVQVDDAFLGGERNGGKRGRGSENKVPLIAAVQTTADGLSSLVGVKSANCSHEAIIHGTGKQSAQHPRFLAINTLLGNLKMWMNTTFRGL